MFCWKCGDDNPKRYRYCGFCGAPAGKPDRPAFDPFTQTDASFSDLMGAGSSAAQALVENVLQIRPLSGLFRQALRQSHTFEHITENGSTRIVYRDRSGKARTYRSREEMPPRLRRWFDRATRHLPPEGQPQDESPHREAPPDPRTVPLARPVSARRPLLRRLAALLSAIVVFYWLFT